MVYQLAPPDRTGMLMGLSRRAVAVLGAAAVTGVWAFTKAAPVLGVAVMIVALAVVVARVDGGPAIETVPIRARFWWQRRGGRGRWQARLPLPDSQTVTCPPWPGVLAGLELLAAGEDEHRVTGAGEMAVVWDRPAGTVSATVTVAGHHFGLVDPADQDSALEGWGKAMDGFVRERTPVVCFRWTELAAPAGAAQHLRFFAEQCHDPDSGPARAYRELVTSAAPAVTRHEAAVTVTVEMGRGAARRSGRHDARSAAIQALGSEMRLLAKRLENTDWTVSDPWDLATTCPAVRARLDPTGLAGMDRRTSSLGRAAGLVGPGSAGPLDCQAELRWWRADGSYHRAFYVSDWPRVALPAAWLSRLLRWDSAVRSVCVIMEPVAPRSSTRAVRKEATKLESDRLHRTSQGFRIGGDLRRAAEATERREQELLAGYRELSYAGIIVVSAPSVEDLDRHCDDLDQEAGGCGIDLRPLHGRHDQGFLAALPVGRGLNPPRQLGRP